MAEVARSFPCPECGEKVAIERIAIVSVHSELDARLNDPEFLRHVVRRQGLAIGAEMTKRGLVTVSNGRADDRNMTVPYRAVAGVVSPTIVATMEERIAKRQDEVAQEVIEDAARRINHFGSHYGYDSVPKSVAREALADALKATRERRRALATVQAEVVT
jgi:hypothetical protein